MVVTSLCDIDLWILLRVPMVSDVSSSGLIQLWQTKWCCYTQKLAAWSENFILMWICCSFISTQLYPYCWINAQFSASHRWATPNSLKPNWLYVFLCFALMFEKIQHDCKKFFWSQSSPAGSFWAVPHYPQAKWDSHYIEQATAN